MNVKVFTKSFCPYCTSLREVLSQNQIKHEEINLTSDRELLEKLQAETGHKTVPMIFIDENFIGGLSEFNTYLENSK